MPDGNPASPSLLSFPQGFLWGAATAAHQVEGGNANNDWWLWEQAAGRIANGDCSGPACDHYVRFREDFDLLAALGHTAHRLSLEWSRLEPTPGSFDRDAIEHYRAVLLALRERGLEPFVTLHHFTNPRWLAEAGGWLRAEAIDAFERFAGRMVAEYRELVRYWITVNEPTVYAYHAYLLGARPPGARSPRSMLLALRNLVRAHRRAFQAIKRLAPGARVGLAHQRTVFDPARPRVPVDRFMARVRLWLVDEACTAAVAATEDFHGINYYTRGITRFARAPGRLFACEDAPPAAAPRSALGWEVYPEGLYRVARRAAARSNGAKPIVVLENGVADTADELRPSFLVQHLHALHRAITTGAPVIGYLHWTSMDNFEWTDGYGARFGLIAVDRATQARHPKPSAYLYADIIRANGLTADVLRRYGPAGS